MTKSRVHKQSQDLHHGAMAEEAANKIPTSKYLTYYRLRHGRVLWARRPLVELMPSPHIQSSWRLDINPPPGCWWVVHIKIRSGRSVSEPYLTKDSLAR